MLEVWPYERDSRSFIYPASDVTREVNSTAQSIPTQKLELSSGLKSLTVTQLIVGEREPNLGVFERQ